MKVEVSALMDGELDEDRAASALDALSRQKDLRLDWDAWHLLGDSLRQEVETPVADGRFMKNFMARLEDEPTVLAPRAVPPSRPETNDRKRFLMPVAASVMGVSAVAWVAQTLSVAPPAISVASVQSVAAKRVAAIPAPVVPGPNVDVSGAVRTVSLAPQAGHIREYVMAHEGNSPWGGIQGPIRYQRSLMETGQGEGR